MVTVPQIAWCISRHISKRSAAHRDMEVDGWIFWFTLKYRDCVLSPHFSRDCSRDCTGTVQGLYRDCATTAKTRRTPVPSSLLLAGASAQATPLPLLPHVHYTDGDRHGRNVCVPLVPTRTFRNETQLRDTAAYPGCAKGGARLHGRLGKLRATSDRESSLTISSWPRSIGASQRHETFDWYTETVTALACGH